jgi:hypothetical protein
MYDLSLGVHVVELSRLRTAELLREAEVERMLRRNRRERGVRTWLSRLLQWRSSRTAVKNDCPEPVTA